MVEIIAIVFSLISVILTIRRSVWCWAVGSVGIVAYFVCFLQAELYAQMVLQILFLAQAVVGWVNWNKDSDGNSKIVNIKQLSNKWLIALTVLLVALCVEMYFTLNTTNDKIVVSLDIVTTILAIIANYLITQRKIDGWYFWIVCDILMIVLFLKVGLLLSSVLYFGLLGLSIVGLLTWKKSIKTV